MTDREREYLRELAKRQLEYANSPENHKKEEHWIRHSRGEDMLPLVVVEHESFLDELLPPVQCEDPVAREIERELNRNLVNAEFIDDDKVVPDFFRFYFEINLKEFNLEIEKKYGVDSNGMKIGYTQNHPIADLEEDWHKLCPSVFSLNKKALRRKQMIVEDVLGDLMPVKPENLSLRWYATLSQKVVDLMGMQEMMYSFYDYPEKMHELYQFLEDDVCRVLDWQQKEGLITPNNGNHFIGSGSYGYTDLLTPPADGKCALSDVWLNINSQETVSISPEMYETFVFPHYRNIAERFGMVYYGCCEPVDPIWESCISKLPHLKKVSISPWCNEEFMGEALRGTGIVYSRKPNPNLVATAKEWDPDAFAQSIRKSLEAAKGCSMEFIFRDVYSLHGDQYKAKDMTALTRRIIEQYW